MILTPTGKRLLNTPSIRHELSGMLLCTEATIIRQIKQNVPYGPLTRLAVLLRAARMCRVSPWDLVELTDKKDDFIKEQFTQLKKTFPKTL